MGERERGRGEVLEGGGREVGMLDLLHLLDLLDLGVGAIGAIGVIGVIGVIGLEVWSDGLCTGHPSSRSVVFAPFRTIPPWRSDVTCTRWLEVGYAGAYIYRG